MSLFSKVLSRAAVPGVSIGVPAVPKGHLPSLRRSEAPKEDPEAQALRQMEEEEEMAQPLRRVEGEEEAAQPLRRAEEEEAQTLRRAEEEEAQPLHRAEEEEAVQPLRRVEVEEEELRTLRRTVEEEGVQALRRAEVEPEEEEAQAMHRVEAEPEEELQTLHRTEEEEEAVQPLRRQEEEEEEELAQPLRRLNTQDEEMPKEPSPLQALRRDTEGQAMGPEMGAGMGGQDRATPVPGFEMDSVGQGWAPDVPAAPQPERPRVQIDQIDVVIQEDSPRTTVNGSGDALSWDLSRRLRSTYLRGL